MAKARFIYTCSECGDQTSQWSGKCTACGAWNTLLESMGADKRDHKVVSYRGVAPVSSIQSLKDISAEHSHRLDTGLPELDRVLGGGLVLGSAVLIGGDPGIGKSTLLLQTGSFLSEAARVLYVTGEESPQQLALRARRLGALAGNVRLLAETRLQAILKGVQKEQPQVVIIDSIQTVYSDELQSAPGSVSQVRECAARLVSLAKHNGVALFLVGHVTKEGALAGPRVLEHMVDTVLYFEGDGSSRYRIIRATKNRFGAVNEIGVFVMDETGLREVNNPSAMFISGQGAAVPGASVLVTQEGTRPLLVEVQALVDESHLANPRRVCVGLDSNRLAMLLAVLHRHAGIATLGQDIFINVAGGIRVTETASDLAVLAAIVSSLRNRPLGKELVIFGEVGLGGELRPVQRGQERIHEAAKLGFRRILLPYANRPKKTNKDIEVLTAKKLEEALSLL